MSRRLAILLLWLALLAACAVGVSRARFTADLSAFLPTSPSREQQLLVDLLRDGMISRLLLIGIEGGDADARTRASSALAKRLREAQDFVSISNGEAVNLEADRQWLFSQRYVLSPAVTPERFSSEGLHRAIGASIDLLASSAGMLVKPLLARDPTGETLLLLEALSGSSQPPKRNGVWVSRDGARSLLLATTRAQGADTDGLEAAIGTVRQAFAELPQEPGLAPLRLVMTGPGVFAVNTRATIKDEAMRLALTGASLIVALLLLVYRSPLALLLGLVPVVTGALAGIMAVSLAFGSVHGLTLGFGVTLIGEAVDYAIYFFIQGRGGAPRLFWRTIALGVATSLCGFGALLVSGFPGLAQLGLFSMAGLSAAALTTRSLLPAITPDSLKIRDLTGLGQALARIIAGAQPLRWLPVALALAALPVLLARHDRLWQHELSALGSTSQAEQALDASLRADLGAPDVRYLVVTTAATADAALALADRLTPTLDALQAAGVIAGYDSPVRFLPSLAQQAARRNSLPAADVLAARLVAATRELPLSADKLGAFVGDVEAARQAPPLTRAMMDGTSLAMAVDAMLIRQGAEWRALIPLRSPPGGPAAHTLDAERIRSALAGTAAEHSVFVDLKAESDGLYSGYLREAWRAALGGVAAIVAVLVFSLRSARRVGRVLLPLLATILVLVAAFALAGERLTLLHLVGMLLVVAVGSNYALFFAGSEHGETLPGATLASLLIANLTTLAGFGVLAFSSVTVLHAIGIVVGPGAVLALLFAALLSARRPA
ncbi:MMPL family transporter [Accumulibacter sp.]|uniref:MMPL family transporter n=1 Tax=Accumulibacter sp. TaxID=2053492 RepID=UPI0028C468F3|nr:MMPL family transporter [Accumulibacter sp.]